MSRPSPFLAGDQNFRKSPLPEMTFLAASLTAPAILFIPSITPSIMFLPQSIALSFKSVNQPLILSYKVFSGFEIQFQAPLNIVLIPFHKPLIILFPDSFIPSMSPVNRSEEHTSALQSRGHLVC